MRTHRSLDQHESRKHSRPRLAAEQSSAKDLATEQAKIAAIGVHVSRSVTSHGFALNVDTDLRYFNLIIPCGIASKPVTSMAKVLSKSMDMAKVTNSVVRHFGDVFQSQILWIDTLDALLGETVGVPLKVPAELREIHKEEEPFWA